MDDHVHIRTAHGIYTTRGLNTGQNIRVCGIYRAGTGERVFEGSSYEKEVDEFGTGWTRDDPAAVVTHDVTGPHILLGIGSIEQTWDPFVPLELPGEWQRLYDVLAQFVPSQDIGIIGSRLIGIATDTSDADLIVRGTDDNRQALRHAMPAIRNELGATQKLGEHLLERSIAKYEHLYGAKNNDFASMIERRWTTVNYAAGMQKIRFSTLHAAEPPGEEREETTLEGRVSDAYRTDEMPRTFEVDGVRVRTYRWDYTNCVHDGDRVRVVGAIDDRGTIHIARNGHGIAFI